MEAQDKFIEDLGKYILFKKEYSGFLMFDEEIQINSGQVREISYSSIAEEKNIKVKDNSLKLNLEDWKSANSLKELNEKICTCTNCSLSKTRKNFVFGTGNYNAQLVVVGEAPGADEDEQGKPFVGRAGQLLTKILESINFSRDEVFICNILKCRPPGNRNPMPDEIAKCEPYLEKQLELLNPKMILAVGTFAAQTLLKSSFPLGKLRGKFHDYKGIKTMVTFHPAALLRNPNWKKPTWEDVQMLRKEFDKIVR